MAATFYARLAEENLVHTVLQLFVAGTDTTATALLWAWLLTMTNPDVQRRVHEEIDAHIGELCPQHLSRPLGALLPMLLKKIR